MLEANDSRPASEIALVLGRILMDSGFSDLFQHDAVRAGAVLGLTLEPTTIAHICDRLAKLNALDSSARGRISSSLSHFERWKQV